MANRKTKVETTSESSNDIKLPVMGSALLLTTAELENRIREINVEIDCLEEQLPKLENELFYRRNPECRPKHCP